MLLSSRRNDQALANIEQVFTGTQDMFSFQIWQKETPAPPSLTWDSTDEARVETGHHEEEMPGLVWTG